MSRRLVPALLSLLALTAGTAGSAAGQSGGTTPPSTDPPPTEQQPEGGEPPSRSVRLFSARARPGIAFHFGLKPSRFAIELTAKRPTDVRIDIVRKGVGVIRSLYQLDVPPRTRRIVPWDGLAADGTRTSGRLRFLVRGVSGEAITESKRFRGQLKFGSYDHIFPIRGQHSYGDSVGAGRGHQGQDMPSRCGTRLVAARAGTVKASGYQAGGAGNYLVVEGKGTGFDYVYMHMRSRAVVSNGQKVRTGQEVGSVGSTGRSTGCHLHFELWETPGWYSGGVAVNPTPWLRGWDRYS